MLYRGSDKRMNSSSACHKPSSFSSLDHGGPRVKHLYIHIPFCKKKCNYCGFISYAGKEHLIELYVEAICKEIISLTRKCKLLFPLPNKEDELDFETVYIGGGTPTLLEPRHYENILGSVVTACSSFTARKEKRSGLKFADRAEITTEAYPGTADKNKLRALRSCGINRLSIGAQSFNDTLLKTLGRIHTSKDIFNIYRDARSAGFENINIDLMFGLPFQTLRNWKVDLAQAVALKPDHLSTYNLKIEEGTPFREKLKQYNCSQLAKNNVTPLTDRVIGGQSYLPSEETKMLIFMHTIETLTKAGYKHYEISNFSRPGYECLHEINYWNNGNYLGVGAGAHSHVNGRYWSNPCCVEAYIKNIPCPVTETPSNNLFNRRESPFKGLRLLAGQPVDNFKGFETEVAELLADGLIARQNDNYILTHDGLFLSNFVFEKLIPHHQ